ncbi:unnamed protein product [Medioppia subpectinata]|uniref:Phorbol-ester/DAG-type domain-containing protein n=1 Tax=Medioppia subpectinata TaxID=1979941 RepID=A0A7R9L2R1_9ACAR|nr:unnamed protein product [Medioppia subpectinata]CAG2114313.1 unnamed protein product [Medioppia subpectinata]
MDLVLRERDAFKLEIDSQREEYEEILDNERKKLTAAETQLANDRKMYRELEDKISTQEQSLYSNDEVIVALDSKISHLEEQLIAIKEEAAKHITTIGNLKDQNSKLTHGFQQSVEKVDELEERIESLHTQLDVREDEINREKGAYIQQLAQQKKAIDHLQDTNDSLMKQKKFVPNSPRQPNCPLEMNDLYKSLAEEKSNNRRLVDEIQRLKGDANYFKNEVFQLKNSIKFDDLSVKSNDSNEHVFRKPLFCAENKKHVNQRVENRLHSTPATAAPPPDNWSLGSQRMHHNIPHRFVETTNKLPNNKCVSCAETIHFGRKAVKCSECGATTHAKCSLKLPNNCGLPVQMMQQLFHSSYDVNENQLADAYYQTQRIDDVINVEPLEPSAPEETFVKYDDNSDSSGTTDNNEPDNGAVLTDVLDADYREIQDICDKENDGFSFTDSMLEVLDREYK